MRASAAAAAGYPTWVQASAPEASPEEGLADHGATIATAATLSSIDGMRGSSPCSRSRPPPRAHGTHRDREPPSRDTPGSAPAGVEATLELVERVLEPTDPASEMEALEAAGWPPRPPSRRTGGGSRPAAGHVRTTRRGGSGGAEPRRGRRGSRGARLRAARRRGRPRRGERPSAGASTRPGRSRTPRR